MGLNKNGRAKITSLDLADRLLIRLLTTAAAGRPRSFHDPGVKAVHARMAEALLHPGSCFMNYLDKVIFLEFLSPIWILDPELLNNCLSHPTPLRFAWRARS